MFCCSGTPPMAGPDLFKSIREVGGVFRFGRGVLGKSAIILGVLMIGVVVAAWRLRSDTAIVLVIALGAAIFFLWLFPVLKFSEKHPDVALLEGAEWTGYKRFEASAKYLPTQPEQQPTLSPGSLELSATLEDIEEPDK